MSCPDLIVEGDRCGDVSLATSPFVSNRYHFGMLLGVADLDAEQAYHRGKAWLHNAWLHGAGVVWGLRVRVDPEHRELVVEPGLAIDASGRELYVAETMCVDISEWYDQRRPDDLEVEERADGSIAFTVHVELCHDSCLDRPVPSIAQSCEGADRDTAYSRSVERGLPRVVGGAAPEPAAPDYPRLRQFFGQLPVEDELVTTALDDVAAAAEAERPATRLLWLRRLAAEDTMELGPVEEPDDCVLLAQVRMHLDSDGSVVADDATAVDNWVRASHVRTRTIQELL